MYRYVASDPELFESLIRYSKLYEKSDPDPKQIVSYPQQIVSDPNPKPVIVTLLFYSTYTYEGIHIRVFGVTNIGCP
jgi:hypothetical protein